jgi:hypothetical protein
VSGAAVTAETSCAVVGVGIALPYSPLAHALGFRPLPVLFLAILGGMTATYLGLVELGKGRFFHHRDLRVSRNQRAGGRGCGPPPFGRDSKAWRRLPTIRTRSSPS